MKKMVSLLCISGILVALVACSESSKTSTDATPEYIEYDVQWGQSESPGSEVTITTVGTMNALIYDDEYVTINFIGCEQNANGEQYLVFSVENKTEVTLTFQSDAMAINGTDLGKIVGSDYIAPQSKGEIRFNAKKELPTMSPELLSGSITVVDFSKTIADDSSTVNMVNFASVEC